MLGMVGGICTFSQVVLLIPPQNSLSDKPDRPAARGKCHHSWGHYSAPLARSSRFRRKSPKASGRRCGQDGRNNAFASLTSLSSVPHRSAGTLAHASPMSPGTNDRGYRHDGRRAVVVPQ